MGNYLMGNVCFENVKMYYVSKHKVLTETCLGVTIPVRDRVVCNTTMTTPKQVFVLFYGSPSHA